MSNSRNIYLDPVQLDFFDKLSINRPSVGAASNKSKNFELVDSSVSNKWSLHSLEDLKTLCTKLEIDIKDLEHRLFDANRTNDDMRQDYQIDLNALKNQLDFLNSEIDSRKKLNVINESTESRTKQILADISINEVDRLANELFKNVCLANHSLLKLYLKVISSIGSNSLLSSYSDFASYPDTVKNLDDLISFGYRLIAILHISNNKVPNAMLLELSSEVDVAVRTAEELMYQIFLHDKKRYKYSLEDLQRNGSSKFLEIQSNGRIPESQDSIGLEYQCKKSELIFNLTYNSSGVLTRIEYYSPYFNARLYWKI